MGRYSGKHFKIEPKEAKLICSLASTYYLKGYTDNPNKDKQIAEQINSTWNNNRTGKDIKSFLQHVDREGLTLEDFCD